MSDSFEPEVDDIKAMRSENGGRDLRAFMRAQIASGKARREPPPKTAPPKPPGHRPGAWPAGSSPPGPPPERQIPQHVWAAAARHLSNEIHRPDQPCDCGHCPPEETR
ncbi:hypothetical protein PV755_09265 [Streptomyces caniscabiei]|uniref:Uncharacterized protein n=1 Tax=Streptomyces caniscabiei TaxID=2746961 RepID=A0A927QII7_9ACTN|nr:hypothetical protein [Streptomyces caniscabiei]MBD9721919.1 hypothetical protein [Streptomyces caniscabiei]MDX3509110.1 hypothetical protein [Streptomyces caniscabiei]MDX3717137.1 hypothetical protein [Streptomyces caniscabiei]WEO23004.1 hypothetical protein IHE65_07460 [Streptomyces caniscabiei]